MYEVPRIVKFIVAKEEWLLPGAGGRRNWELLFSGCGAAAGQGEKGLEVGEGHGCMAG